MQNRTQKQLNSEEWTKIIDFSDDGMGFTLPKYEAKFVEDVEKEYIANEIVLVKKTSSINGGEQIFQFPAEVFEGIAHQVR